MRPVHIAGQREEPPRSQFCVARGCRICAGLRPEGAPAAGARPRLAVPGAQSVANPVAPASYGVAALVCHRQSRTLLDHLFAESSEFRRCGLYCRPTTALRDLCRLHPHLLLVELELPERCGLQCARELQARLPRARVIMTSARLDPFLLQHAAAAGIDDWLVRPFSLDQCRAMLRFLAWRIVQEAAPVFGAGPPAVARSRAGTRPAPALSPREARVLRGLAAGGLYKEIADQLRLSLPAVKNARHRLYRKLHARTRTEAIRLGKQLQPPDNSLG